MTLKSRIQAFLRLGEILRRFASTGQEKNSTDIKYFNKLQNAIDRAYEMNPWFIPRFITEVLRTIGSNLEKAHLEEWISNYRGLDQNGHKPKIVGVVNAGNIPLVGFHDFLSVLISGNIFYGKLSSKDEYLPKAVAEILTGIESEFTSYIRFERAFLKKFDAIIATGSNNTSRYFNYYFGRYPHIIRKNRNSVAVLTGVESDRELTGLTDDMMLYFGLGCRNVSKIYLPDDFTLEKLIDSLENYRSLADHNKYANNYNYNKAMYIMNRIPHRDNGFVLFRENDQLASPISSVHYEKYSNIEKVRGKLEQIRDQIQCIVSHSSKFRNAVQFGRAQYPELWDYADERDTLEFLLSLNSS